VRLAVLLLLAAAAVAETHRVGPGGHGTIGAALAAAAPGDTVVVAKGVYEERLVIGKPVRLVGEGWPRIFGGYEGDVVLVQADDVEITGLEIAGSGRPMITSASGIKVRASKARIHGNRIVDNLFGVYLRECGDAVIEGNVIRGRAEDEVGVRGAGINLFDAHRNVVRGNEVSFVRDGVYFDHADNNLVDGNEFFELRYGIHYMFCNANSFTGNVFRDSMGGAAIMYTEGLTFRGNRMIDNRRGINAFGLLLKDCRNSVAEGNAFVNNTRGVFLDNSHGNLLRKNLVAYNDIGVMLFASSLENRFTGNDFVGNLSTLLTVGRADADWTPDGVGNHYSDYQGYDLDGDGTGDVEHRLQDAFEYLVGSRPLLRLFLNSAVADALCAAERSFPLVPTSDERDRAPFLKPASGVSLDRARRGGASGPVAAASIFTCLLAAWLYRRSCA
jgi:nitrous oxidase accessory protein